MILRDLLPEPPPAEFTDFETIVNRGEFDGMRQRDLMEKSHRLNSTSCSGMAACMEAQVPRNACPVFGLGTIQTDAQTTLEDEENQNKSSFFTLWLYCCLRGLMDGLNRQPTAEARSLIYDCTEMAKLQLWRVSFEEAVNVALHRVKGWIPSLKTYLVTLDHVLSSIVLHGNAVRMTQPCLASVNPKCLDLPLWISSCFSIYRLKILPREQFNTPQTQMRRQEKALRSMRLIKLQMKESKLLANGGEEKRRPNLEMWTTFYGGGR
ncbi:hypothetical protein LINGRAHAP2_LOCUS34649 [Linum grandiflorum]